MALPSMSQAGYGHLMKMLITLAPRGISSSNFVNNLTDTGMQNGHKSLQTIILASRSRLVKMLITLERHGIFRSNFAYL